MKFHLYLPQMRLSHEAILDRAHLAEQVGFEGMGFMDHLAPPLAYEQPMWEAMSTATWTLARTETLKVGHLVLCDAFRHPALLARQATSLDHASGGRFELGLGWGSVPAEFDTFGVGSTKARARVDRMAESLAVMRALWSGESFDHEGEYFTLQGAQQKPVPTAPIPLTVGGVGPRTLELVRQYADWWNIPVHELGRLAELRDLAGETARISVQQMIAPVTDESQRAEVTELVRKRFGKTRFYENIVVGNAAELIEHFAHLEELGVSRSYAWFADFATPSSLEAFAEVIEHW
jgi:alkanesulfonate monooxygenase SsuD/methylene tetrahydromethanopterin reductase-like flavin-dependent oxidoreductase (luciferase family)